MSSGIPYLRLPEPALLFEARARRLERLERLAGGDPFLALLARVAGGQREAARALRTAGGGAVRERLLSTEAISADGALLPALAPILAAARAAPLPPAAEAAVAGLADAGDAAVRRLAAAVLAGRVTDEQRAAAPFAGAALQVVAAVRAAGMDPAAVPRAGHGAGCPVCGSPPVAGTIGGDDRLRHLACALCSAEWHVPRLHCATCGANEGLAYRHPEQDPGARAETCERCRTYVKLFDLEKRPGAEPLADDAATLALDLLLGEEGYARGGVNLLVAI